jgi:hypothetical protein
MDYSDGLPLLGIVLAESADSGSEAISDRQPVLRSCASVWVVRLRGPVVLGQ